MQRRDRRHAGRQRHVHERFVVAAEQALDAAERRAERDAALAEHRVQRRRTVGILMAARGDGGAIDPLGRRLCDRDGAGMLDPFAR